MELFYSFPLSKQKQLIWDAIQPGSVIKLHCNFTKPPKEKRMVIVSTDPAIGIFLINSKISNFVLINKALLQSQIPLANKNYSFIEHDSYLDCKDIFKDFSYAEIEKTLRNDYSRFLGKIDNQLRDLIVNACLGSATLEQKDILQIVKELNGKSFV